MGKLKIAIVVLTLIALFQSLALIGNYKDIKQYEEDCTCRWYMSGNHERLQNYNDFGTKKVEVVRVHVAADWLLVRYEENGMIIALKIPGILIEAEAEYINGKNEYNYFYDSQNSEFIIDTGNEVIYLNAEML